MRGELTSITEPTYWSSELRTRVQLLELQNPGYYMMQQHALYKSL